MKQIIALVSNSALGLVKFRRDLIKELKTKDCEVIGFAPDFNLDQARELFALGAKPVTYTLSRTGINPLRELISIISLFFAIRREKPKSIFCFQIKAAVFGTIAGILSGIDNIFIMIEGLGYVFTGDAFINKYLKKIISFLLKHTFAKAKKVFMLNNDDREEFMRLKIIKPEKSVLLGGIGVNLTEWPYSEPTQHRISFIFVGRLLKEKGIMEYLKAAEMIKKKYPRVEFYVIGDTDSNPGSIKKGDIIKFVEKGIVQWPGFVEVKPWLEKSSIFVLPSYREGMPRSTQEAMAIGRPVITTDVAGCRDTVVDGVNGFIIPSRNVTLLAEAMERFILNSELIKKMGKESRRIAEQKFDAELKNRIIMDEMGLI